MDEGHKIWYCGEDLKHQYGMAFVGRKEVLGNITGCTPISSRLISIQISMRPHNIKFIQVYVPTSDHEDEEVKHFYEQRDSIIAKTPKKDILLVQGNWNAKVSPYAYQHWAGTIGRLGIGKTNDRGWRLREFAKSHQLTFANALHPHKLSRTATWHAPNGQVHHQIDFILTPQRFQSSINKADTRSKSRKVFMSGQHSL